MAEPRLAELHLIAVTLPGHGGTPPPEDLGIERAAELMAGFAAERGCDLVVGFSIGASVALEMAASGAFRGPLILLGPSLSLKDEAMALRMLDRLAHLLCDLPFVVMRRLLGLALRQSRIPAGRQAVLLVEFQRNDPHVMRGIIDRYLTYLGRHGSVVSRLCRSGVRAWVVHADHGDGGLTNVERRILEACPRITVVTIPGTSWFLPNEEPARIADLVIDALA
jgi:pimeloyl-ACP methyl ester carboxylesterase